MPAPRLRQHGPVTEITLDATWAGRVIYPFRAYFVDGLLIDTGPPCQAAAFEAVMQHLGVEQAVNTHHHEDHAGNNAMLHDRFGVTPWAHAACVPLLEQLPPIQMYRRLTWGASTDAPAKPLGEWLETSRYRFRVLHTPGHSPDHIVLHEPNEGWLFGGDLYIADRLKLLRREEDPHLLLDSVNRTLALDFGTIFCAHRGVVADGHAAMTRKRDFLGEVREQTLALHARGLSERAIARKLLGKSDFLELISAGDFSRVNMVKAFLPGWRGPAKMPERGRPWHLP